MIMAGLFCSGKAVLTTHKTLGLILNSSEVQNDKLIGGDVPVCDVPTII